ncbi:hypothetical protein CVT26_012485 [Gymnopilus dilepis]|uniref:G-protein coupled receptors family 1 profile domain-containing protein n=1 Tax=Gymnopilus dilepis TaxID=231916 RepID=A0A409YCX3_9AGAR|nr:hypothetical protein CVT26_012485 [Gymnopilus dilepis]
MDFPSDASQERVLDAGFNGQLLTNMLIGAYTVVFLGTAYIYRMVLLMHRLGFVPIVGKASRSNLVFGSITILYVAYLVQVAIEWYSAKQAFINNGTTRESIFISFFLGPGWETYVTDICTFVVAIFADALLEKMGVERLQQIWRCFNVWDRSLRAICLPSFFLLGEIGTVFCCLISTVSLTPFAGIDLALIIIAPIAHFQPSPSQTHTLNALIGSSLFVTSAATITSTLLIAYRIHATSKHNVLKSSRSRFNHIVEILAESAAAYAVASLALAIESIIPQTSSSNNLVVLVCNAYLTPLYGFIAGVAPTIMVARVALAPDKVNDISAISHISGLHFQSTALTSTQGGHDRESLPDQGYLEDSEKALAKDAAAVRFA